jgi:hypothetical protein
MAALLRAGPGIPVALWDKFYFMVDILGEFWGLDGSQEGWEVQSFAVILTPVLLKVKRQSVNQPLGTCYIFSSCFFNVL